MGKQSFERIKKILSILLLVLFIVSVTAATVSADRANFDPTWGTNSKRNYNNAYNFQKSIGNTDGQVKGAADGDYDCKNGADTKDSSRYHKTTTFTTAAKLGAIDGYNDGFDSTYESSYNDAMQACNQAGNTNIYLTKP